MTGLIPSTFFNAQQPLKEVRERVSTVHIAGIGAWMFEGEFTNFNGIVLPDQNGLKLFKLLNLKNTESTCWKVPLLLSPS
jgi:hypothetical protein